MLTNIDFCTLVTTAELASNALSLIRGGEVPYDLVIAEVDLLDMSGITLLNQILLINEEISVICKKIYFFNLFSIQETFYFILLIISILYTLCPFFCFV